MLTNRSTTLISPESNGDYGALEIEKVPWRQGQQ
jgi:hypothetical protein